MTALHPDEQARELADQIDDLCEAKGQIATVAAPMIATLLARVRLAEAE